MIILRFFVNRAPGL